MKQQTNFNAFYIHFQWRTSIPLAYSANFLSELKKVRPSSRKENLFISTDINTTACGETKISRTKAPKQCAMTSPSPPHVRVSHTNENAFFI